MVNFWRAGSPSLAVGSLPGSASLRPRPPMKLSARTDFFGGGRGPAAPALRTPHAAGGFGADGRVHSNDRQRTELAVWSRPEVEFCACSAPFRHSGALSRDSGRPDAKTLASDFAQNRYTGRGAWSRLGASRPARQRAPRLPHTPHPNKPRRL